MKKNLFKKICMPSLVCIATMHTVNFPVISALELKDSGISYTETVETINNPSAGYTQTVWSVCRPGETPVHNPTGNIVLFFIDIGQFSSGINEDGTDYDLDETFFNSWRKTFENCRANGCMTALRFRYDANGIDNPEPATFEKVLEHIQQIKDSNILEEYKDIIAFVESGFVGKWGEQHGGKYTSVEHKAQLLDAMLKCVPAPIPVTVRTPDIFARWANINRKELADYICIPGTDATRVGLYDDGYMGSSSDLGTYSNRQIETQWLGNQTVSSYFGGEFSGNLEFAQSFETYLPENSITEMYNTHLSYINGNIFKLYKDFTFDETYDIKDVKYQPFSSSVSLTPDYDHSAYYGQDVFTFIRDHLGYRYVLRKSELSSDVKQGEDITIDFSVENTGFANAIPAQKAELIIEKDGSYMKVQTDIDSNQWRSCTVAHETITASLPDNISTGEWNAYLKLSQGNNKTDQMGMRSVRFANNGIWNSVIGANYLGTFTVAENKTPGTDNTFSSDGFSSDIMYSDAGQVVVDGLADEREWNEDMLLADNGTDKLYMTSDDKYLYVMAKIPGKAQAAVYNLQIYNEETKKQYWIYYTSGGFIYYNNGSYDRCLCKWNGDTVEFRIPFEVMNLTPGTALRSVRISLQDSANEWVACGDIKSKECTVPENFNIYTAPKDIRLNFGESHTVSVITTLENASYQWYLDKTEIPGATKPEYTITADEKSTGIYSVKITSENRTEKTTDICNLIEVMNIPQQNTTLKGDVNLDGVVNVCDILKLAEYLFNISDISGFENADMNDDGKINIMDLCRLKYRFLSELYL
ncbi:MAG: DUF4832 domain-containing protein [Oscillospiraceae bacterium]|nr:DUF4832 domain-containing protein [Oscillospiraceae bacterium]